MLHKDEFTQTEEEEIEDKGTAVSASTDIDLTTALEFIKTCSPDEFNMIWTSISQKFPKSMYPVPQQAMYIVPPQNYMYAMPSQFQYYDALGNYYQ